VRPGALAEDTSDERGASAEDTSDEGGASAIWEESSASLQVSTRIIFSSSVLTELGQSHKGKGSSDSGLGQSSCSVQYQQSKRASRPSSG
jgi:hypothetical protein